MNIGIIGLGQMGRGMAQRLIERGHQLAVWNRSRAAAESFAARGARVADTPDGVLSADVVITMLADDTAVETVWLASQLSEKLPQGAVHLNMSSVSPRVGERLERAHGEHGAHYVSAPVFGRPEFAARGEVDIRSEEHTSELQSH